MYSRVTASAGEERSSDGSAYTDYLSRMADRREPGEHPTVVYQGEPGAYSEMAVRKFFGSQVHCVGLENFEDPFLALSRGEADYAVLPIENSSTGAIRQVYDLLGQYPVFCTGETTVRVCHALMALPGVTMEEITTVCSHEQGLMQCESFLRQHPQWHTAAQADTAGSARLVAEKGDRQIAAICSTLAAELYGLNILQENISSNPSNTTRFLVLAPGPELREGSNKICITLTGTGHADTLQKVLAILTERGIRLLHLESRPLPESVWAYRYFIEFAGNLTTAETAAALREISLHAADLRVLGNYRENLSGD